MMPNYSITKPKITKQHNYTHVYITRNFDGITVPVEKKWLLDEYAHELELIVQPRYLGVLEEAFKKKNSQRKNKMRMSNALASIAVSNREGLFALEKCIQDVINGVNYNNGNDNRENWVIMDRIILLLEELGGRIKPLKRWRRRKEENE